MPKEIVVSNVQTAVEIYYNYPELGTSEIVRLFSCCKATAARLKAKAREVQREQGIITFTSRTVNTKCAYEAWHLNIADLEKRLLKLQKLQKGVYTQ